MANEQDNIEKMYINNNLNVKNGIYQKIQMLVETTVPVPKDENILIQKSMIQQKAEKFENRSVENPLVWKINEYLYVVCEASNCRTESATKKNNIDALVEYLHKAHGEHYLTVSFKRSSISANFKKCVVYDDAVFDLQVACEISKISKFWIECNENNVLIIEMKNGKENVIMFLIACILAYNKANWTAESALDTILMSNPLKFQIKNIKLKISNQLLDTQNTTINWLYLTQLPSFLL